MKPFLGKINRLKLFFLIFTGFIFTSCFIFESSPLLEKNDNNEFIIPSDTLISIKHTAFLGQSYSIIISADGNAVLTPTEYQGHGAPNISQGIPIKNRLSQKQLAKIIQKFEEANFFSFKERYEMGEGECTDNLTDGSAETISITIKGRKKSLYWENCFKSGQIIPSKLADINSEIEKAVNLKQLYN